MKKILVIAAFFGGILLNVQSSYADLLVEDVDINDQAWTFYNMSYWGADDTNPDDLNDNSDASELAWVKAVTADATVVFLEKLENDPGPVPIEVDFEWEYALIKKARNSYLFQDTNGNNILDDLDYEIPNGDDAYSHVSFFSADPRTVVPEPGTMLLFGTGIASLAGFARRKRN